MAIMAVVVIIVLKSAEHGSGALAGLVIISLFLESRYFFPGIFFFFLNLYYFIHKPASLSVAEGQTAFPN